MAKTTLSNNKGINARILVVDDDTSVARLIGELLDSRGFRATVVNDSQEALEKFKLDPGKFHMLITDQTMPRMTGAELAQEILAIQPDLPIILCTGYSEEIDEVRAKALGIRGYFYKPLDVQVFMDMVRQLLESQLVVSS